MKTPVLWLKEPGTRRCGREVTAVFRPRRSQLTSITNWCRLRPAPSRGSVPGHQGTIVTLATTAVDYGGSWRHILDLAESVRALDVEVQVAVLPTAGKLARDARGRGFFVLGWAVAHRSRVLHVHLADTFDWRALVLVARAKLWGNRVVLTEHLPRSGASDPTLAQRLPRRGVMGAKFCFKRVQYSLSDQVIAVSEGSARFIVQQYRVHPSKVVLVRNGIDSKEPLSPGIGETTEPPGSGTPTFISVGSIIYQKGYDVLVEAATLARACWSVQVYGDGPHREALTESANEHEGSGAKVRFCGWSNDVSALLAESSGVVMPSRWEAFPYVPLEAMAAGRAVIASAVDGVSETVIDGITGILVPPGDAAALAAALDYASTHQDELTKMGWAGRERVKLFSKKEMAMRTSQVYLRAAEK